MGKPTKNDEGNVKFLVASTRMAGPGFGCFMAKITAEGVKTINGKPFDPPPKATVTGTMIVPKDGSSFEGRVVEIRLVVVRFAVYGGSSRTPRPESRVSWHPPILR